MANVSIGVYLGTESMEVVCLSGTFHHPRLMHSGTAPIPLETSWRSQIRAEEREPTEKSSSLYAQETQAQEPIIRAAHALLDKIGLPSSKAHVGVAPESVVVRYFQMPTLPYRERKMAIAFEAKKYLPFKLEELNVDYQVVISRSDPTLMRVMFFGIKKGSMKTYLSLLGSVNVTPICLEPASISLMRLLRQTGQLPPNEVAVILSVEQETATITIARHDLLYLSRNVTILTTAEPGQPEPSTELLDALLNETRISIDYYRRRFMGEPSVAKVIVFGKEMDSRRIQELSSALKLPAEAGETFKKIAGGDHPPSELAIATGLALRGLERKGIETNLLPLEQRRHAEGILRPLLLQGTAAALLLTTWFGFSIADLKTLKTKLTTIQSQQVLPKGIPSNQPIPELVKFNQTHREESKFLAYVVEHSMKTSRLLQELSELIPDETWLRHTAIEATWVEQQNRKFPVGQAQFLNLEGASYAQNRGQELNQINSFLKALRENDLFSNRFSKFSLDSVDRITFRGEETTQFQMTFASDKATLWKQPRPSSGRRRR